MALLLYGPLPRRAYAAGKVKWAKMKFIEPPLKSEAALALGGASAQWPLARASAGTLNMGGGASQPEPENLNSLSGLGAARARP